MKRRGFTIFDVVFIVAMVVLGFGVGYWLTSGNIVWSLLAAILSLGISTINVIRARRAYRRGP